jgi:hypothetical protein
MLTGCNMTLGKKILNDPRIGPAYFVDLKIIFSVNVVVLLLQFFHSGKLFSKVMKA